MRSANRKAMFAKLRRIPTLISKSEKRRWYYRGGFEDFEGKNIKVSNKKGTYFVKYRYPLNKLFDVEDIIKVVDGFGKGVVNSKYIRKGR